YVIPGAVVHFFLRSLRGTPVGLAKGLCSLGVRLQHAKSPALRRLRGLEEARGDGVLVTDVAPLSPAADAGIQVGDVLLAVDGVPVAEDGTVPFRDMERIGFEFLITRKVVGETMRVQLLTGGKEGQAIAVPAELELKADHVEKLVPRRDGLTVIVLLFSDWFTKEEPHEDISLPSFQSRLTEWAEQCLRFQASGETWVPTKPCCPANPFLDLEACRWQGLKQGQAKACVQLLSLEELCELHRFFLENPHYEPFQTQPSSASNPQPNLICMQMRPWMRDPEPTREAEDDRPGSLEVLPGSVGSVETCEKPSEVEPRARGQSKAKLRVKAVKAKAKAMKLQLKPKAPAKRFSSAVRGVYFFEKQRRWEVRLWDFCAKEGRYGGRFKTQEEAEAKAREMTEKPKQRPQIPSKASKGAAVTETEPSPSPSPSSKPAKVKGVHYHKARRCWHVYLYDPSAKTRRFGGSFAVKKDAVAKARGLARQFSDVKGVYWHSASKRWQVRVYDPSEQKTIYAGTFKLQKEAEARAQKLGKELKGRGKRKPPPRATRPASRA
ncbi:DEGP10, partial [Symbiodinium microadriaticum]